MPRVPRTRPADVVALAGRTRDRLADARRRRRLPAPPAIVTDAAGLRYELLHAEEIEVFDRSRGHFEGREIDFVRRTLRAGVAIDVGAHIGFFTAPMARALGDRGTVHAFEANPPVAARLARTIALNALPNVVTHGEAVSDAVGSAELLLYGAGREGWSSLTRDTISIAEGELRPTERTEVATTTLDAFCAEQGIERVALLKVDVEGAEGRVVAGAERLLGDRRVDVMLMELSDNTLRNDGVRAEALVRRLARLGYVAHKLDETGTPRALRVDGHVEFENVVLLPA